ncbi:Putative AC transposase [Frankliniella fusca]|uniref:AC transposase n=1 Tax=Frankliniella fusca TaxID=407009 RepID=A0AAE1HWD7_9NEOP|nr:Putative AC transposase [Frankliniella fusca]
MRKKISEELKGKMCSMAVDGCSRNQRHFIGINVQYELNGEKVVRTLAVEELFVSSTAANLKHIISMVCKKFDIPIKSIVSFTTDSGANYILAGKLLNEENLEFDYDIDYDLPEDIQLIQGEFSIQSVRCAAHTLQLAVEDAVKPRVGSESLKPLLIAVRKLANFLRNPSNVLQIKEENLPLPSLDCVTRWGSTYDMVASVFKLRNFLDRKFTFNSAKEKAENSLTGTQWSAVEELLEDLRPARKATIKLQAQNLTLGEFYKIWTQLTMTLQKRNSDLAKRLVDAMNERSKSVHYKERGRRGEERLSPLFNYPAFNAALLMDPRYFSLLTAEQVMDGKAYLVDLWQRLQVIRGLLDTEDNVDSDLEVEEQINFSADDSDDDTDDSGFNKLLEQRNRDRQILKEGQGNQSGRAKIRALLDEYDRVTDPLPPSADIMKYWQGRKAVSPELYDLAMIVLVIPATQVTVERLFSSLRFILRPQRFNLSGDNVDNVILLHANKDLTRQLVLELLK